MAYTITDVVNSSSAARQRREEALRGLDLPEEGGYVRGCVPREYLRLMAEEEAAPGGATQVALHLHDEARAAGLEAVVEADEYNSPGDYDVRVGRRLTLMVQGCGHGRSYILDGKSGFLIKDMPYGAWSELFKEVAASKK